MNILGIYLEGKIVQDIEIFKKYVSNYDLNDPNIEQKFFHSIRVSNNAKEIAESINLNDKDKHLATFIGLTHDIGRFLQWKVYGIFADSKSIDHALLSVQVLFGKGLDTGFVISDEDANIIRIAVYNHNKYKIQDDATERELLFAKIIRDADKLDLLYLLGEKDIVSEEDNSEVTDVIHNDFWNYKELDKSDCKTLTDKILLKMAFIFDFNFSKSFEILERENLLDNYFNNLKYKERYEKYYLHAKEFLKAKKISE